MLDEITACLVGYAVTYPQYPLDNLLKASQEILKMLEEKGMLPPLAMVHSSPYPKEHEFYGPNKTLENEWEPEND